MRLERVFMELDRQQLDRLLSGLSARFGQGLTGERRTRFALELAQLSSDDDVLLEDTVLLSGVELPFALNVFGSEGELLEAGFLVPGPIAGIVVEEAERLFGHLSIRRIAGMADA